MQQIGIILGLYKSSNTALYYSLCLYTTTVLWSTSCTFKNSKFYAHRPEDVSTHSAPPLSTPLPISFIYRDAVSTISLFFDSIVKSKKCSEVFSCLYCFWTFKVIASVHLKTRRMSLCDLKLFSVFKCTDEIVHGRNTSFN